MDYETLLSMLKVDLGISTTAYDERLEAYLEAAEGYIASKGVTLDADDLGDQQGCVMYAAWMWRRRDTMEGMPRMLQSWLHSRLVSEKMNDG